MNGPPHVSEIPNYLKHGDRYPDAILKEHSPETTHITIALAIRLWREHGEGETEAMRARPNPYEPGKRHDAALKIIESGEIADAAKITTSSTGSPIERGPRRR